MKKSYTLLLFIFFISNNISSQVILSADGPGDTYELINSVLALPTRDVVEVPDCNHTAFGRHIDEVFDNELNKYVFRFHIHVEPDNDRCQKEDRQRNEIKSYDKSPENTKANIGETIEYKWKFKLNDNFKVSPNFTHIHQIKSVGGDYASIPMITLTLRKSSPDRLELRYTSTNDQNTLKTADLNLLRGNWLEVTEVIKFGDSGTYSIEIKKVSNNEVVFSYSNSSIDLWQDGAEFARPKWGIYRSLINQQDLKDESVLFADFSIDENPNLLSVDDLKLKAENIFLYPNPSSSEVEFKNANSENFDAIKFYDARGKNISIDNRFYETKLNVSGFSKGLYFVVFKKDTVIVKVIKCIIQ